MQLDDIQKEIVHTMKTFDGLIIIHPDAIPNFGSVYMRNLAFATYFCINLGIPVVAIPDNDAVRVTQYYPEALTRYWETLHQEEYYFPVSSLNFISEQSNIPIKDLRTAFAGIWYDACPNSFARRTCQVVSAPEAVAPWDDGEHACIKAAYGLLVKELCQI